MVVASTPCHLIYVAATLYLNYVQMSACVGVWHHQLDIKYMITLNYISSVSKYKQKLVNES